MLWELVMPLINMGENIPLKQNVSMRAFLTMLHMKRNISLTQDKISTCVLYQTASQVFLNPFQPALALFKNQAISR